MTHTETAPAGNAPTSRPEARPSAVAKFTTIWARAVRDKTTVVAALAFYGLAIGAGVGALWPPLEETFADLAETLPAGFEAILGGVSLATPAGWMNAEMLTILGPGFLIATVLISAASATAGEEQARTLSLVLTTGVSRNTFLAAKTAAVVTHLLIVDIAMFFGMLIGNAIGDLRIEVGMIAAATIWMFLLGLMYAAITLTIGALTGERRLTMGITAGIAAVSFILAIFLPLNESLTDLGKINLWYPYSGNVALVNGIDWGLATLMIGITVVVSVIGFIGFRHRSNLRG